MACLYLQFIQEEKGRFVNLAFPNKKNFTQIYSATIHLDFKLLISPREKQMFSVYNKNFFKNIEAQKLRTT